MKYLDTSGPLADFNMDEDNLQEAELIPLRALLQALKKVGLRGIDFSDMKNIMSEEILSTAQKKRIVEIICVSGSYEKIYYRKYQSHLNHVELISFEKFEQLFCQ